MAQRIAVLSTSTATGSMSSSISSNNNTKHSFYYCQLEAFRSSDPRREPWSLLGAAVLATLTGAGLLVSDSQQQQHHFSTSIAECCGIVGIVGTNDDARYVLVAF